MAARIDSILVPTDGSEVATLGARVGIDLAARADADLHVLSVVESATVEPVLDDQSTADRAERERTLEARASDAVDAIAGRGMTHLRGRVTTAVEWGEPFRVIDDYVASNDVDLVVMGTHGRTGLDRVLGSVIDKTLRTASVPVVAVPPSVDDVPVGEATYEDVLVPTDGSDEAAVALDWALALLGLYDGTLHTVYSVDTSWFGGHEEVADVHDALEARGERALAAMRERAREADVSVRGSIGTGPAARTIRSYSERNDVDAVVMATHGRSGVERYLIGSVTEAVVRTSDVPVCCVPITEDALRS